MNKIKERCHLWAIPCLVFFSFVLWIFSFRGFLSGQLMLVSDAVSYYDHIKFTVDNILRGTYPMWDPTWNFNVPNEFFLRRIGVFNPFFSLILVLRKTGIPHLFAYLIYLAAYYFAGMIGFYLLAKRIFRDSRIAFAAYILLMFSSLGTRLFDSYIMLIFVPMVWFFFFLVAFTQEREKHFFLGIIFTLMIILTTYIPFYFVTIFASFIICFVLVYFRDLKTIFSRYGEFLKGNKILVSLCALGVILSLLPGFLFYQEAGKGEVVFPWRHTNYSHTRAPGQNEMEVDIYNITKWGGLEDIVYSSVFTDLRKFRFAVLYIPVFGFILFFLGVFTSINKRLILFASWALMLFLIAAPHEPLYNFLYDRVPFFRYFRNLHFFVWVTLLPIFILFLAEQLRMFLNYCPRTKKERYAVVAFLLSVHAGFMVFFYRQENMIVSSCLVVILSLVFFLLHYAGRLQQRRGLFLFLLLGIVVAQPLEVYHYLDRNSEERIALYGYGRPGDRPDDRLYLNFSFTRWKKTAVNPDTGIQRDPASAPTRYISTNWYNFIFKNLNPDILRNYVRHKFIVYDRVEGIDGERPDLKRIGRAFLENQNMAFVASVGPGYKAQKYSSVSATHAPHAQPVTENSEQFQVLKYDSNSIKVKTNFDSRKFLVYNESFHSGWQAFVNGKEADLQRANVAFQGLWIPPGENIVYLRYGARGRYFIEFLVFGVIYGVFFYLLWSWMMTRLRPDVTSGLRRAGTPIQQ